MTDEVLGGHASVASGTAAVEPNVVVGEAAEIQAMRDLLDSIAARLASVYQFPSTAEARNQGQLLETVRYAESALFRVLNVGNAYMHCAACKEALEASYAGEEAVPA